ncbi:hypothetical protein RHECIAT_CH0004108 [Rhizobium etli CIAT 652]|uniref:Uncharacterized protein n=1 Tax=Rhizobium etli (strain CIAT 652) TaxID=491916 RepID=B3PQ25_RHIE6|nr:hypothetical protein RHECIAT_CH0004108 [Rhizobium etli CIAT 652]
MRVVCNNKDLRQPGWTLWQTVTRPPPEGLPELPLHPPFVAVERCPVIRIDHRLDVVEDEPIGRNLRVPERRAGRPSLEMVGQHLALQFLVPGKRLRKVADGGDDRTRRRAGEVSRDAFLATRGL